MFKTNTYSSYKKMLMYFLIYLTLSLGLIYFSFIFIDNSNSIELTVKKLFFEDALYIFFLNSIQFLLYFILSPFGLSIPFVIKFIISIGQSSHSTNIDPLIYYFSSLSHALGEILVSFILILFTFKQFKAFYYVYKYKSTNYLKQLYSKLLKKYIPLSLTILLISAFFEVYISNAVILKIIN
ncbi:hypothetical protein GCM10007111_44270 [Virgibacillus kapii]|uniref:Stage II sporulation protein M n=1 Tax=Virgibacillus kapii TaxID=1638645 RepID=A0ABQ2E0L5_9BACI|nr:hypothetical protein GCM10007111_44270 [Virgibacillus kapii]